MLQPARFIKRLHRFGAEIEINGQHHTAHMPNPGRMRELLVPDARIFVLHAPSPHRKTAYSLLAVEYNGLLVSLDSTLPNRFMPEMIGNSLFPPFEHCHVTGREITFEDSRLDLAAECNGKKVLIEIKSCTLVENGHAMFPDAPTTRGARHMNTLAMAVEQGYRAASVIVVQRPDAVCFSPNRLTDPAFDQAYWHAVDAGVEPWVIVTRPTLFRTLEFVSYFGRERISRLPDGGFTKDFSCR